HLVAREVLSKAPVSGIMTRAPVTAGPDISIADLVENYFLGRYLKLVPIVSGERLLGLVDVRAVKAVPREAWAQRRVAEIIAPVSDQNTITPQSDAHAALDLMQRTGQSRLLVVEGDRLVGIVSLKDMLRALSLRLDFGPPEMAQPAPHDRPGHPRPGRA